MCKPLDILFIILTLVTILSCQPASNKQAKIDIVNIPAVSSDDTTLATSLDNDYQTVDTIKRCHQTIDALTGLTFYENPEKLAENNGGIDAIRRAFEKRLTIDSTTVDVPENPSRVQFIVDTNGKVLGERIIPNTDSSIGKQIIEVVKSFSWRPAECNGKRVISMVKQTLILEFQ